MAYTLTWIHRDIVIIHNKVNEKAFRSIEIFVVFCLPASAWPAIIYCIYISEANIGSLSEFTHSLMGPVGVLSDQQGALNGQGSQDQNGLSKAFAITATLAVLVPNAMYFLYIWIAAVIDKRQIDTLGPTHPDSQAQSSSRTEKKWYLIDTERTSLERAAVVNNCASYIFKHSVFRKHVYVAAISSRTPRLIAPVTCQL